ncbi:hypothetical protein [Melittangium boletus]|nr:hypothetical protein [Melittangium boletus]
MPAILLPVVADGFWTTARPREGSIRVRRRPDLALGAQAARGSRD